MTPLSALQEELTFENAGRFVAEVEIEDLGIDQEMLDRSLEIGPLCYLDFEATGLDPKTDELIEAGAALVTAGEARAKIFNSYIHAHNPLSPFIQRLTGIDQSDVESAPPLEEVAKALDEFIGEAPIVAHNKDFEQKWLAEYVNPRFAHHPFLDTIELLALVYPDSRNLKLDTFCRSKLDRKERHRALDDALDTLRIAVGVFTEARDGSPAGANAYRALRSFRPSSPWTERLSSLPEAGRLKSARSEDASAKEPALEAVPLDFHAIADRLADDAAGGSVIPGYESRPAQVELLEHAFDCFAGKEGKSVRICEAGTGIGKTLAYLAVAIPFARTTGEQVIISTSSKLLQSQLIEKDLPAAAKLLGYADLRFTAMKGRANYLCRSRLDHFLDRSSGMLPEPDSFSLALVSAFSRSAGHGEVDRIPGVLYNMNPDLEAVRREVTSGDATECSRQTCETTGGQCVFRDARGRLDNAEIIVVNHDLLLRWPPDYPPLRHLVIDEVHDLAERADGAYARHAESIELTHRLERLLGRKGDEPVTKDERVASLSKLALEQVEAIGLEARRIVGGEVPAGGWRDELAVALDGPGPSWSELVDATLDLGQTLDEIGKRLAALAENDESPEAGTAEVLLDSATILRDSFPAPPPDLVVRFRGLARPGTNSWRLVATPVSPAADFQFEILDRATTLFGTSATVAVGGDARGALGALELPERAGSRYRMEEPVDSPFDYERNLQVVYIDERTDRETLVRNTVETISTLAKRLGGRTMGLFTSRDRLSLAGDELFAKLMADGISVIAPAAGNADPHDLVRTFMETDQAVLLGARAFWQGVDVPGDACQAVVIEKLPFDVPGDPLIRRRGELIEREGGNSFMDFMLPRMLLRLKQMIGRLIRTPTDRGLVVLVESRCDKRYFSRLHDALPPNAGRVCLPLSELKDVVDDFAASR
jgi:Rad3-related DNA helicase/inhibitor of KinA sporulation pathway (predicted exonuclease)